MLGNIPKNVTKITAAIAYTHSKKLIEHCLKENVALDWWGLFDSGNSTDLEIIKMAIDSSNIRFYPFADHFHPKIIHFEGYGIYIGSHNMTYSALYHNVEAGIFIEEHEITDEQRLDISALFEFLRKNSIPATKDDIEKIDEYIQLTQIDRENQEHIQTGLDDYFEEQFKHLFIIKPGVEDYGRTRGDKESKRKFIFLQEWREAQNFLGIVQRRIVSECVQPKWVNFGAETTIITDQLLHAYYYTYLLKGNDEHKSIEIVNNEYRKNKNNQDDAITTAIRWWETLLIAPSSEDIHINKWSVSNKQVLENLRTRDLTHDELLMVMSQNHAARNHARQIKNKYFNLPKDFKTDIEGRVKIYVDWIFAQKTESKLSISDTLRFLLFDNSSIEERVYETVNNPKYHFEHLERSIVGELIGWGRPDITHLRNNRVNKALRCLGYDVRLFSE